MVAPVFGAWVRRERRPRQGSQKRFGGEPLPGLQKRGLWRYHGAMSHSTHISRFLFAAITVLLPAAVLGAALSGCGKGDVLTAARAAATGDLATAAKTVAVSKATRYATNPEALLWDAKRFAGVLENFRKAIDEAWGKDEAREPSPREYVKYIQNYKSRAMVDFDAGVVTVETLDQDKPLASLRSAIATTLLTPGDPRAVDLYTAGEVRLGDEPFLLGEIKDFDGKDVRWAWRAERFADALVARGPGTRTLADGRVVRSVTIPMVRDHLHVRAGKYEPLVTSMAKRYKISPNLVFAVIKTESDFNPFAVSHAPAFGLMQIVPTSAGREVRRVMDGKDEPPSKDFLFEPENNIRYGAAYLHLLDTRHLDGIENPLSREYCTIAAYNTGAGNVLRTFDTNRDKARRAINAMAPAEVYETLRKRLPYDETRRYLHKVMQAKKLFVGSGA